MPGAIAPSAYMRSGIGSCVARLLGASLCIVGAMEVHAFITR